MSIKDDIAELEAQLAELRLQEEQGFTVDICSYEEYYWNFHHTVVRDSENEIAGIIINEDVMKKYVESLK